MKKLLYILILGAYSGFSQPTFKLLTTINTKADFVTCDNQSNVYVVKGNELCKYNKTGKLLYKYSNKNLGNIDFVDASNLLKILLFYKNFLQVVYLDNTLSANGEPVALDNIGYQQAQLACSSYNNSVWLYDQQNLELVRLDINLEKIVGTGNLSILLNINMQPNYLLEHDNRIYLNNPSTGILVFDIYGTYYKTIPIKNVLQVQPRGEVIYYMTENNKLQSYHIKTTDMKDVKMPDVEFNNFRVENDLLILQNNDSILVYSNE